MTGSPHVLSIIAVTFNEERHIARLPRAVAALIRPAGVVVETILVDGGSRDQTLAEARRAGFTRILECPGASIPVCRNAGLRAARGDWIAFVDGDCEPAPDWLEQAAHFLAREPAAILGWPARPPDPLNWLQAAWLFHWTRKNPRREERHGRPVVAHEGFRLATTRNLLLHRAVTDRIGGFNEALTTGEDTDFAFRAYQAGVPVLGVPALVVYHHGEPATLGQFFRQQLWHANRKSYREIVKESGGRVGGNAPLFTLAFLLSALIALAGLAGSALSHSPWCLTGALPWLAVVGGPAFLMCARARSWRHLPALCLLYATYGLARSIDLLGLHPAKPSWKSPAPR